MAAAMGAASAGSLGILAEFENEEQILSAAAQVRDQGFRHWDTHTPYPVHGLERAMGLAATPLPWIVLLGGFTGASVGTLMQWWMNAYDYAYLISGKRFWSIPATIPVTFELTILFSAFGAFFGMIIMNGLPQYYHWTFHSENFKRHTDDRFFISIESRDSQYSSGTADFLRGLGALSVEVIEEE